MGYSGETWGHITSGGTIANLEALWTDLPQDEIKTQVDQRLAAHSISGKGIQRFFSDLGTETVAAPLALVPATAHYSMQKVVEALGLGKQQIKMIPVDSRFRTDVDALREILFTAGGFAWRAWDRGSLGKIYEGIAFEPWEDWRNNRFEGPSGLVSAAIFASNPHNSQPWLFRVDERRIDLYANMSRSLRGIDPFLREMYIGLGSAPISASHGSCRQSDSWAEA
jgi:hypothetical protein